MFVGPGEPTEPTEPTAPTAPTAMTEPTEPTEPTATTATTARAPVPCLGCKVASGRRVTAHTLLQESSGGLL